MFKVIKSAVRTTIIKLHSFLVIVVSDNTYDCSRQPRHVLFVGLNTGTKLFMLFYLNQTTKIRNSKLNVKSIKRKTIPIVLLNILCSLIPKQKGARCVSEALLKRCIHIKAYKKVTVKSTRQVVLCHRYHGVRGCLEKLRGLDKEFVGCKM